VPSLLATSSIGKTTANYKQRKFEPKTPTVSFFHKRFALYLLVGKKETHSGKVFFLLELSIDNIECVGTEFESDDHLRD
jgi:hypothetical protein